MRSRTLVDGASVVAVALFLGWVLSLATTQVKNWFVMTDELYYERLAISVAQTGSLLPRIHGEIVSNVNQLYPILISPFYGDGNVPASFAAAHRLNAFLIASAAIPVYLLARRIGVGWLIGLWAGALSVAVPWVALSSFLLTEVVAYPAFCWALLALTHAVARKSWPTDLLGLFAIGFAVLARTQFVVLLAVFVVAVVVEAMLEATPRGAPAKLWRTRRPFVVLVGCLLVVVLGAIAIGKGSQLLGSYSVTAEHVRIDVGLFRLAFEHVALLALGLAILPFIVGVGWLVDRARPSAPGPERAFAVIGCTTLVLVTFQVASFNQRFGAGLVKDRYLFYVVPVIVVALAAAVASRQWPRWWALVIPTIVAAIGFASAPLPLYEKFNVDSPIAILNDELLKLATSIRWAHVLLVLAALVAVQALLLAKAFLPWRAVAVPVAVLASLALPLETVYAFDRLFAVNGTNGLPVTLDQGVVFDWVDRNVGPTGRVTVMKYPVGGTRLVGGPGVLVGPRVLERERRSDDGRHVAEAGAALAHAVRPAHRSRTRLHGRRSSRSSTRPTCASGSPADRWSSTATRTCSRPSGRGGRPGWPTASTPTAGPGRTGRRGSPSSPNRARRRRCAASSRSPSRRRTRSSTGR